MTSYFIDGNDDHSFTEQRFSVSCSDCGQMIEYMHPNDLDRAIRRHNCLTIPFQELRTKVEMLESRLGQLEATIANIDDRPWIMKTRNP